MDRCGGRNILGEGKFLVGPGLKVQKQKEGYDCRKARGTVCAYMTRLERQVWASLLQGASS